MQIKKLLPVTFVSTALLLAFWLWGYTVEPLQAQGGPQAPDGIIRYVATNGTDTGECTASSSPCATVQYAVDQAIAGDEIRVATGVYTDIHTRVDKPQIVYISKTVTVRGGYSSDFSTWDPKTYTTTLDAHHAGRGIYIMGKINAVVDSLYITGGEAIGIPWFTENGGGICVITATVTINNCRFSDNHVKNFYGNALSLSYSHNSILANNFISDNDGDHGSVNLFSSDALLINNVIYHNSNGDTGGEVYLNSSNVTLNHNLIFENSNIGIRATQSDITMNNNIVAFNSLDGLRLSQSNITMNNNIVIANSENGIQASEGHVTMNNNIVTNNAGSGIHITNGTTILHHTTLVRNYHYGLYVTDSVPGQCHVELTDTIIANNMTGVSVGSNCVASLEATLWGSGAWANGTDWEGNNVNLGTINLHGDPEFVDPSVGDYHIQPTSIAVDAGVDAGVTYDIDGEVRPSRFGFDIGADEVSGPALMITGKAPQTLYNLGEVITYTIRLTNEGTTTADNVLLSDTLPAEQRLLALVTSPLMACTTNNSGRETLTCEMSCLLPNETMVITLTAQIASTAPAALPITMENVAQARSDNAASNQIKVTTLLQDCHARINGDLPEYKQIQAAVDAAQTGDTVWVAGVCTEPETRAGLRQIVYLDRSVNLRGGYNTDFSEWNPLAYPTTLDALNKGRVLYITGNITPTVEGFHLVGGNATGLGGGANGGGDVGDGAYIITATAIINRCYISNFPGSRTGCGVYLLHSNSTLKDNIVTNNHGLGVDVEYSHATLSGNLISNNHYYGVYSIFSTAILDGNTISGHTCDDFGGGNGVVAEKSILTLRNNTIVGNKAFGTGGGVSLSYCTATLSDNTISNNIASGGGGGVALLDETNATLSNNIISGNKANEQGGGVHLFNSSVTMNNNIIADNTDSGIYVNGKLTLRHTTIARNSGAGVYVSRARGNVTMIDTILVSNTMGISVATGCIATLNATLWGSGAWANETDWGGAGTITTGTINLWADPGFVNPAIGDYHLRSTSAAVDAGIDAGLTTDIDSDSRPLSWGYDIGADEWDPGVHPLTNVAISGPTSGYTNTTYTFIANPVPENATPPLTYTWFPTPTAVSGPIVTYTWGTLGMHTITVTAQNCYSTVTSSQTIRIYPHGELIGVRKTVTPTGSVSYGDKLTYTLVITGSAGDTINLYDPLIGTAFLHFVKPVSGVVHTNGSIAGSLTMPPTTPVTVSFVVQVGVPGTLGLTTNIPNRACIYPADQSTLLYCLWSNTVINPATHFYKVYLPLVTRSP